MVDVENDPLTAKIIACCFEVHKQLGPGFPEKVYHNSLKVLFAERKIDYVSEKEFGVFFNNKKVGDFRCDLLVEKRVIVELKSVTGIMPILFRNQLISYLKASKIKTGLLVNFGNKSCEIKRVSY